MPSSESRKAYAKAVDQRAQWDDPEWDHHDAAACDRAVRLLNRPSIGFHRVTDGFRGAGRAVRRSVWAGRALLGLASLGVIFALGFGALWLRLGAGPVNLDSMTPWLASAIEENLGKDHTVEVGGTQIERAGRVRIAVRLRDIVVRDRAHNIVASAPKAEVRLSGLGLMTGRLRAETLRLVGAELAVRITPDGRVIVSTGRSDSPLATGKVPVKQPVQPDGAAPAGMPDSAASGNVAAASPNGTNGLLAALDWLDSLSANGLDGQSLNEIGLRNGVLTVEDQRNGGLINFKNISLSLRRPLGGGAAFSVGEEGKSGWDLKVAVGAPENGVRSIAINADNVPVNNLLLAARLKDFTYSADMPLSGELKGEIGRDGLPTYFQGQLALGKGTIVDLKVPDYPMTIDQADARIEWDAGRRVMVAPFHINSGANRITTMAHLEPPNDSVPNWQLGLSGGTILLGGENNDPVIFNRIAVRVRFDTDNRRVMLTQCDISNGEIGVAGSGGIDYSGEPRLTLGLAATPMPVTVLKRIWPVLVTPEVREWLVERVERGTVQRFDIAVNAPTSTLVRGGPPIPDDGLSVNFAASGLSIRPVDDLPVVRDGDMKGRVSGRTVSVNVGQGIVDTPAGRRLTISDLVFEVPDLAPKPAPAKVRFRIEGPVPAAAEILQSERLRDSGDSTVIDPAASKGTVSAMVTLGMPLKNALTKADTTYSVTLDLGALAVDKLALNQKLEANNLKVVADNQGYRVKGDVKIGGQPASLDYRKVNEGDADVRVSAVLDDAARARLGVDLGPSLSGSIPVKLTGKIAGESGGDNRFGVEADLTAAKIDNVLPGWTKLAGRNTKMTFNVVQKPQGTRFEDIVVDGNGTLIKGTLEVDDKNDIVSVSFPTFAPSEGDKASLKAERAPDGTLKVTMRGDVFDGRGFIKSAMSGRDQTAKEKSKHFDIDIDAKVGALAGFYGEALRSLDLKLSRRNGVVRTFSLNGKIGRDTQLLGDLRGRTQGREVLYVETSDAGAFFRFTDTYAKMSGGKMWLAIDPPSSDSTPQEGLLNVRDFNVKGEAALDRAANNPAGSAQGVGFSGLRAEFVRQGGQLRIKDGVVRGPAIGGTIEGTIDYPLNQVRMSGTFVPLYGLNNMFGQIPVVGLFLGGGSNEGLFGITYEVVGTPGAPVLRVNPVSAMAPGVFRKIFDFNTGRQNVPTDFATSPNQ